MSFAENWAALCLLVCMVSLVMYLAWIYLQDMGMVQSGGSCRYGYGLSDGPHTWGGSFSQSRGKAQSPINIDNRHVRVVKNAQPLFVRHGYEMMPASLHIQNTGHTVELSTNFASGPPSIVYAKSAVKYELSIIAFRWNSEHTIDHRQFPLEVQAIHVRFESVASQPTEQKAKLLIISYLFDETAHNNPYLDPVCMHLNSVCRKGDVHAMRPFPLSWLCPEMQSGFYQYTGSLTFPPCAESTEWLVNTRVGYIGSAQMIQFKMLLDSNGDRIAFNNRPVQPLNGRVVTLNQF